MTKPARTLTVVVDRHQLGQDHGYCVHGYTHCTRCNHAVCLGDGTLAQVQVGARPLCLECATELQSQGGLPSSKRVFHVSDHRG